jgi:mycofactocin system FadH/OYE family oxidoreductase 2
VHAHGVPVLAQLNHHGGQGSGLYARRVPQAPSPVADPLFREVPRAVSAAQIREITAAYALVARNCAAAGFDGVELQCAHSSIIRQFLSPELNRRGDEYGGALDGRARLLLEIVGAVRAALGPGRVLGARICGAEGAADDTALAEAVALARLLDGRVDYLSTAIGVAGSSQHLITPGMSVPAGYAMFIPAAVRAAVSVPVIGTGRITAPGQAERALAAGQCDLVGVVRGQIADPQFAAKARAGRADSIRGCLGCNQECVARVGLNRWLGCLVNPRAGREFLPAPARRAARRVCVVGGGPAGLQAAVTAAERGHRVTLLERGPDLGGQLAVAARAAGRAGLGELVRYLGARAGELGVDVRTGVTASAASLLDAAPDVVVLATGSRPAPPGWGHGQPRVADAAEVLDGTVSPAGRVIVVDELGFYPATSAAELLAGRGCDVEVITSGMAVGQDLGLTLDLEAWHAAAAAGGIRQRTEVVVLAARAAPGGGLALELLHHPTGVTEELGCDWVVCAVPARPADELWRALGGPRTSAVPPPFDVHRVGDCVAPRRAHAAVLDGERIGAAL